MKQYRGRVPTSERMPVLATPADRIREELRTGAKYQPFRETLIGEIGAFYMDGPLGQSLIACSEQYAIVREETLNRRGEYDVLETTQAFQLGGFLAVHTLLADAPAVVQGPVLQQPMEAPFTITQTDQPERQNIEMFYEIARCTFQEFTEELQQVVIDASCRAAVGSPSPGTYAVEFRTGFAWTYGYIEEGMPS